VKALKFYHLERIRILLFGLVLSVCVARAASPYEIGTWRGFRPAAISYTFDDGCSNQFSVAVPMFDAAGFKLTLFTVISTMFPGWPKLQDAAARGHEIASHTMTHTNLASLTDAQQITELQNSRDAINANLPGQKCLTLAYPYCVQGKDSLTAQYYIAARTCSGQLIPGSPANFMSLSSYVCGSQGSVQTVQDFNNLANSAAASKAWCVYLIHGIDNDGGYSPLSSVVLQGSLNYLRTNQNKFWVETFGNVARYILERKATSVTEISTNEEHIILQVTNNLDPSTFNYPLTLRRPLPANWPGAAVSQNGQPAARQIVSGGSTKYVMFDIIPGAGDVVLSKESLPITLSQPALGPTAFSFRLDGQAGVSYAVDSSSDLMNWTAVQTNTLTATYTNFNLPPGGDLRFYRARWVP
jgi:oligosaccharide reducing-end xylanase